MKTLQGNKSVLKQQYDTTYTTEKVWCIKFNKTSKIYMFKWRTGVSRPWICHRILLRLCAKLSLRISTCEHLFFYAFSIKSSKFKEIIACTSKNNFVLCGSITSRLEQQQWNEGNKKIKKAIIQEAKHFLTVNVHHTINFGRLLFCHMTKTGSLDQQWQCKYCFNL